MEIRRNSGTNGAAPFHVEINKIKKLHFILKVHNIPKTHFYSLFKNILKINLLINASFSILQIKNALFHELLFSNCNSKYLDIY